MFYQQKFDKVLRQHNNIPSNNFRQSTPKLSRSINEKQSKSPDISKRTSYLDNSQKILSKSNKDYGIARGERSPIRYGENIQSIDKQQKISPSDKNYYFQTRNLDVSQSGLQNKSQSATKLRIKTPAQSSQITTLPTEYEEINYRDKIGKFVQKINKLQSELDLYQEKEIHYLSRMSNLEKENRSLHMTLEERDKKIQELIKRSKEDKSKLFHFINEMENMNSDGLLKDESIVKLLETLDHKSNDRQSILSKGTQTIDIDFDVPKVQIDCSKCEIIVSYCEFLSRKLSEIEESSKYVLNNYQSLKGKFDETKKAEESYIKACSDFETKYYEAKKVLTEKNKNLNESEAELQMIRSILSNMTNEVQNFSQPSSMRSFQKSSIKSNLNSNISQNLSTKNVYNNEPSMHPIAGALKAIACANRIAGK